MERLGRAAEEDVDVEEDVAHVLRDLRRLDVHERQQPLYVVPVRRARGARCVRIAARLRGRCLGIRAGGVEEGREDDDPEGRGGLARGGGDGAREEVGRVVQAV
ncbi:hypothetical protein NUW54_g13026 [Trametes sanguinea]|uniref:Uncharacterized protein n=1 Tax=Trametes sanguinea TaxID=158606 RepID=A0ACC1MSC6_9APHY|nr:hypothetical protein NUW54_g13026 [Trametes sanguinea]